MFSKGRIAIVRDALGTLLWPIPVLAVLLSIGAGIGLPRLDAHVGGNDVNGLSGYVFSGGPDAARSVLSAIASSLITVTSLTFSLTVVTLQLASSQYSPRLLRTFSRDRVVQVTLAMFLSTFTFALTVLRSVRTENGPQRAVVPQVSVTLAFVLAGASVIALVGFLAHLARQIRVEAMVRSVHAEANAAVERLMPKSEDERPGVRRTVPPPPVDATLLCSHKSGFLNGVDTETLLAAAKELGIVVVIDRQPGEPLVSGVPFGRAWPAPGHEHCDDAEEISNRVQRTLIVGYERTTAQDIAFSLRQLTDVTIKALSPSINDPTTAIQTLGHSSSLLCELARRGPGPVVLTDDDDRVRVGVQRPVFADLLDLAVSQPLRYGSDDPAVVGRLLTLLREVAWCARTSDVTDAVSDQLDRVRDRASKAGFDDGEQKSLHRLAEEARNALDGRWEDVTERWISRQAPPASRL